MTHIAGPFALHVTSELIGVRRPALVQYVQVSELIAKAMDGGLIPENIEPGEAARGELNELVVQWISNKPLPGVLSAATNAARGTDIDTRLIINTLGTMFNASFGTLYAMIGNLILLLADHPEALYALEAGASLDTAIDEFLRFDGPAQGTSRVCVKPTTIAGVSIAPGDTVLTLLASANRDDNQFSQADTLVIDRRPNTHLAFAWGAHSCIGAMFGKAAIAELLRTLLMARLAFEVVRPVTRRRTATVRCLTCLPVVLQPK
jgi:cytochrome P450